MTRKGSPAQEMHHRSPTLRDVATRAGVSPSTVSAVLNDAPRAKAYSPETINRVHAIAKEIGYFANPLAKTLKKTKSGMIGAVIFSRHSSYYDFLLQAVESAAHDVGYEVVTADMGYDPARLDHCINSLAAWRVEGLLLLSGGYACGPSVMRTLHETGIPYIKGGVRHPDDPCSSLAFNNREAGRMLAQHLTRLGHIRIGVLAANPSNHQAQERLDGITAFLNGCGQPLEGRRVVRAVDSNIGLSAGFHYAAQLLKSDPSVTSIICANDAMAIGAIRLLRERSIRVPDDVSVTGFDDLCLGNRPHEDDRLGAYLVPALTTIRTPLIAMGETAVRMLVELIAHPDLRRVIRTIEFAPELIVRGSTAPPP